MNLSIRQRQLLAKREYAKGSIPIEHTPVRLPVTARPQRRVPHWLTFCLFLLLWMGFWFAAGYSI